MTNSFFSADVNECDRGPCAQECTDTHGSFVCGCFEGYILGADMSTCACKCETDY